MWITLPQAVSLYARYFRARHGLNASKIAADKAQQLKERGDLQGHQIWSVEEPRPRALVLKSHIVRQK
jgi:hypothetical protein